MYVVYVLESEKGKHYTGHTSDLGRRLLEHDSGLCTTTRRDRDWRVVYLEEYCSRTKAIRRERWLKTGLGREFIRRKLEQGR